MELRPGLDPLKQLETNTLASSVGGDSNVPKNC